ncbi:MAG: DNA mismatch repair endonuclease MutL, partial [Planctomycetota bacterium]
MIQQKHRIQQLSPHLVNQIAAGEVIERPASVVKELLENSLDAGARNIVVELEEGGKRSIRITDDGGGIAPGDLHLAVASHATSKLRCEEDLHRVATLGFRGEALASVASVAELELVSRPEGCEVGEKIVAQDGEVADAAPEMIPVGTRITVQNLFYNVPARKRFLKTDRGELARIHTAVKHIALARPDVGFTLVNGGRSVFACPAGQEPRQRVAEVLGEQHVERLLPVESPPDEATGVVRLRGWVGRPDLAKRNSQTIYTFLNGRFVRDATVLHAVREGYRGFQIPGQYPVAVLFLDLDPADVDVNVHPAKLEVRFRDSSDVHRLVHRAVRATLEEAGSVPQLFTDRTGAAATLTRDDVVAEGPRPAALFRDLPPAAQNERVPAEGAPVRPPAELAGGHRTAGSESTGYGGAGPAAAGTEAGKQQVDAFGPAPTRVFQVRDAYLVIEEADGLTVIDQHALHEKILYEEILEARERG